MTRMTLAILFAITIVAAVGGAILVTTTSFNQGTFIVQSGKVVEFEIGLGLLLVGLVFLAFVAWFFAVNGKDSFFRRRLHLTSLLARQLFNSGF